MKKAAKFRGASELKLRIISGIVLAAIALFVAWAGGALIVLFWGAAAVGLLAEWWKVTKRSVAWLIPGMIYAGVAFASPVLLRLDAAWGLPALLWLFAVVWGSDVFAYICGRLIGGPKLWPRVSPKKTWAGFIGGTAFAIAAGSGIAWLAGVVSILPVSIVSLFAAVASQGGDLLESSIKRSFGVKDSGSLIPGHGGLMDRLDGFVAAGALALAVGVWRGGLTHAGQGLLVW